MTDVSCYQYEFVNPRLWAMGESWVGELVEDLELVERVRRSFVQIAVYMEQERAAGRTPEPRLVKTFESYSPSLERSLLIRRRVN